MTGKDRFPYPVGYKTVRAHNGSTYYMEIEEGAKGPLFLVVHTFFLNGAESYSIDSDTSDTSLEPSVLVATYEGTHDHLDQTLTLDMVHGVHVLALEKKKRGMMQEVLVQKLTTSLLLLLRFFISLDMFTSAQEKLHDWIINVYVPKNRVTSLHQGYGFIEFLREEDADYIPAMNECFVEMVAERVIVESVISG
ncbi:hypothetical protein HID58_059353 [Brassica napus]|uniref:RRM domain-containing protein n=1 Tax=Brassica napus TaxID=3708 RepID=A0ABQ7ZSN6_BRANA|nr:hypothetical protein HID58_059353 [Brassica napus]